MSIRQIIKFYSESEHYNHKCGLGKDTLSNLNSNLSSTADVTITFPTLQPNLTVTEGDHTTLTCIARGVPAPEVMWYRGSEVINGSDSRTEVSSRQWQSITTGFVTVTSEFNITVLSRTDSGMFRCEATNIVLGVLSSDTQSFQVLVSCE